MEKLLEEIALTAELMGHSLSPAAAAVLAHDLREFRFEDVRAALKLVRDEAPRFSPKAIRDALAKVIPDGRPGANEAWAMVPQDETVTVVMTQEMAEAWGIASGLLDLGDFVAARMAFIESYTRLVEQARRAGTAVQWIPSLGTNYEQRITALREAVRLGRLGVRQAEGIMPPEILQLPGSELLAILEPVIMDKTTPEQRQENLASLKVLMSRIVNAA